MNNEKFISISGEQRETSEWTLLREEILQSSHREVEHRLQTNPIPTELEMILGAFVEDLEYPVREAVVNLTRKGYTTLSSGFFGKESRLQALEILGDKYGDIGISDEVCAEVEKIGVKMVASRFVTQIIFEPRNASTDEIKQKWDEIVGLFPDKGILPVPSHSVGSVDFREKYSGRKRIKIMDIQHGLQAGYYDNDPTYRKELEQTLLRLQKEILDDPCPCGSGKEYRVCHGA